jgi:16S rRNA (adenine1518-N6/adenine1519-N6)-dimethyltransferase
MNMLAVSAQLRTTPTVVARVPAKAFRPAPRVESAVILLETLPRPRVETHGDETFFAVARAGFSSRRKQLVNALANGLAIEKSVAASMLAEASIEPSRRAQDLTLEEWSRVAGAHATRTENGTPAGISPSDTKGRAAKAVVGT